MKSTTAPKTAAHFHKAHLHKAHFHKAHFHKAHFHKAHFHKAHLHKAHMTPAIRVELALRNGFVIVASVLFLISIFIGHANGVLKLIAYLCGALAYVCEYLHLTKGMKVKISHDELFMVYCFAPLYILLGLSYLIQH